MMDRLNLSCSDQIDHETVRRPVRRALYAWGALLFALIVGIAALGSIQPSALALVNATPTDQIENLHVFELREDGFTLKWKVVANADKYQVNLWPESDEVAEVSGYPKDEPSPTNASSTEVAHTFTGLEENAVYVVTIFPKEDDGVVYGTLGDWLRVKTLNVTADAGTFWLTEIEPIEGPMLGIAITPITRGIDPDPMMATAKLAWDGDLGLVSNSRDNKVHWVVSKLCVGIGLYASAPGGGTVSLEQTEIQEKRWVANNPENNFMNWQTLYNSDMLHMGRGYYMLFKAGSDDPVATLNFDFPCIDYGPPSRLQPPTIEITDDQEIKTSWLRMPKVEKYTIEITTTDRSNQKLTNFSLASTEVDNDGVNTEQLSSTTLSSSSVNQNQFPLTVSARLTSSNGQTATSAVRICYVGGNYQPCAGDQPTANQGDNPAQPIMVSLALSAASLSLGGANEATLTVRLSRAPRSDVHVAVFAGSAGVISLSTAGSPFSVYMEEGRLTQVAFSSGDTAAKEVKVTAKGVGQSDIVIVAYSHGDDVRRRGSPILVTVTQ